MAAFDLGFLYRVVNVHWGGGGVIFVYADAKGNIFRAKFKDKNDDSPVKSKVAQLKTITGSSGFSAGFFDPDTDPGTPIFLVSGSRGDLDDAVILRSSDGESWSDGYHFANTAGLFSEAQSVAAVTYDPDARAFFMAAVYGTADAITGDNYAWNRHYRSANGSGWSKVYEHLLAEPPGVVTPEKSPFPAAHCSHNDCIDSEGQHVPDGNMSRYDRQSKMKMRPKSPIVINYDSMGLELGVSNEIEILVDNPEVPNTPTTTSVVLPIERATCLAGANGIWVASGFMFNNFWESPGQVFVSTDNGGTWTLFDTTPGGIVTISCAPLAKT